MDTSDQPSVTAVGPVQSDARESLMPLEQQDAVVDHNVSLELTSSAIATASPPPRHKAATPRPPPCL